MRSQAKAPSAASISSREGKVRLVLLSVCAAAFFLISSSNAFAEIVVDLDGTGTGTVTSDPAGIECSNTGGGAPGPACTHEFPTEEPPGSFEEHFVGIKLTAAPDSGSYFAGWSGDDPAPLGAPFGPLCNSGAANPCFVIDLGEYFFPPIHIAATFKPIPDPPAVTTGSASSDPSKRLTTLEGTVNPEAAEVEDCQFEYGLTTKYGTSVPCVPKASELGEGEADQAVSALLELEGLKADTTYHYRLLASNFGGKSEGEDRAFTTDPAPAANASCPNADIRAEQVLGALLLPDCMALEMVSPPQKGGQPANQPAISADGGRARFVSVAALGGTTGALSAGGDEYVATRGPSGWVTASTSPPLGILEGWRSFGTVAGPNSFTPDFSRWFRIGGTRQQTQLGISRALQEGLGGFFSLLSPPMAPLVKPSEFNVRGTQFKGASADHSHLYFVPGPAGDHSPAYLSADPEPDGAGADHNTYVAHLDGEGQPALDLLARDSSNRVWGGNCGARLGGVRLKFEAEEPTGNRNQGAISLDGRRVYFSTRPTQPEAASECEKENNKLRILERLEGKLGVHIGELFGSECFRPDCSSADGDDYFQGASVDGSRVYFTTTRQIADSDHDEGFRCNTEPGESEGCDLYLYDSNLPPGQRLIQVSAGGLVPGANLGDPPIHEIGAGAEVLNGITAISGDGSHVYFVAQGVLTTDAGPKGTFPVAGLPNLYAWDVDSESTAFIGTLDLSDDELWDNDTAPRGLHPVPELGNDAEGDTIGGDGHILVFNSKAALTADDGDGVHRDVFRYDAASDDLSRISKAAPGGLDDGAFDVDGGDNAVTLGTDTAEIGRQVSEDGETVLFVTVEGLISSDVNGARDIYLWQSETLYRLPGKFAASGSAVLSHDGSTIAVATRSSLLPQDGDSAEDIYVARAGGGYTQPKAVEPCQADESLPGSPCQESQPVPPAPSVGAPPPGTGNIKPVPACPKGKRKVRRKGKVRCLARHPRKPHRARHANADRRAAK